MIKVTLLMEISLDGDYTGACLSGEVFYAVAADYPADAVLFGSVTAANGAGEAPPEGEADRRPPVRERLPYLVIPDSGGRLLGRLHVYRRLPYGRDVVVLGSAATPPAYRAYLDERGYRFIEAGAERVDFRQAFSRLNTELGVRSMRCDGGGELIDHLLNEGLAGELVLIFAPHIAGPVRMPLFRGVKRGISLTLEKVRSREGGYVETHYHINGKPDVSRR